MRQIDKNTVSAKNQLKENDYIKFINPEGKGKRVMFVGNSITLHGIRPEIGWHWEWGMAASCAENDYVHLVMKEIQKTDPDAAFCITQISRWERKYHEDYKAVLDLYEASREFGADLVIVRCVENCPWEAYTDEMFTESYTDMIDYLNKENNRVILTTSFWDSPADNAIRKIGEERGYDTIYLGDLGELDEMKALGQFEHDGVCQHPNDNGMREIANRIIKIL